MRRRRRRIRRRIRRRGGRQMADGGWITSIQKMRNINKKKIKNT